MGNEPFRECPRFDACSCNVCPLDPLAHLRDALGGEEECRATRSTRETIAARHLGVLPSGGRLPHEIARDKRRASWAALPEDHPTKVALQIGRRSFRKRDLPTPKKDGTQSAEPDGQIVGRDKNA